MFKHYNQQIELIIFALAAIVGIFYADFREAAGTIMGMCCVIAALRAHDMHSDLHQRLSNLKVNGGNPWKYQRKLMEISDQEIPRGPRMTKTSILYGALILEEAGETMLGLAKGIEEVSNGRNSQLFEIAKKYAAQAIILDRVSKQFREDLKNCTEEPNDHPLSFETAKEILDGCTDLHVVTCGCSISTGLPEMDAYTIVVSSNLSKANPSTGKIDKTPDGKWIKGSAYKEPQLDDLLISYYNNPQL